ncbi:MAG TPA: serine hydrolase domain-containing protein [Nitrolancea sp.]|nr:serine hydrolase domain-containing protein [Nitrolancea sp.]
MNVGNEQFSPARLARMHDVLTGFAARGEVPGLISAVSRRGETHVDVIGTLTPGGHDPIQRDTIFRIASLSKPMAAVAAMILVEECRLRLDEPVDRFLPELANRQVLRRPDAPLDDTVPAVRPITLRDLLTFRSGYGIVMSWPEVYPIQRAMDDLKLNQGPPNPQLPPEPDEWMRRLGTLPLVHQPGERWLYNTGADILGVLIARAADQPLEVFMRERIFAPLGMHDTGFSVPESKIDRLSICYGTNFETGERTVYDPAEGGQWSRPPAFPSAAGGLVSTIDDVLAFGQMLMNNGRSAGGRILSRASVETMTTDHLTPAQKAISGLLSDYFESHGWGFGMAINTRRDSIYTTPGRYGWDGGLGTVWYNDPRAELITVLLTNQTWTSPNPPNVCLDFWTLAQQAIND